MDRKEKAFRISSIPLLGCVLEAILVIIYGGNDQIVLEECKEEDAPTVCIVAAQKHFRQRQQVWLG